MANTFSTALILLPPVSIQRQANLLRSGWDKSFPRWTAHITLFFPFVPDGALPSTIDAICSALHAIPGDGFVLTLDRVGTFKMRDYDTVYLTTSHGRDIKALHDALSEVVGYRGRPFVPHLTLGQVSRQGKDAEFLLNKAATLLQRTPMSWEVQSIVVLRKDEQDGGRMKIFTEIPLGTSKPYLPSISSVDPTTFALSTASTLVVAPSCSTKSFQIATYNILCDQDHNPTYRFPSLKRDIFSSSADILCLQEVTNEFLSMLLSDADILRDYAYCTHSPADVLPCARNIIVLSRGDFSFTWKTLGLGSKHKNATLLELPFSGSWVLLAVVHFTAGQKAEQISKRKGEARLLIDHISRRYASHDWIIAGDTNINVEDLLDGTLLDAWSTIRCGEEGYTYDPARNLLAMQTVKAAKQSFRYNRIYIKRGGSLSISGVEIFGSEEDPASDHWGLCATLEVSGDSAAEELQDISTNYPTLSDEGRVIYVQSDADSLLERFLIDGAWILSSSQAEDRRRAVLVLRHVLTGDHVNITDPSSGESSSSQGIHLLPAGVKLVLTLIGSCALGVDNSASDLDMLVVGNISITSFYAITWLRIRAWNGRRANVDAITIKRLVRDATVPIMQLDVFGVDVDVQYSAAGSVVERWDVLPSLPSDDPLFLLPSASLRTLNAYRDVLYILSSIPSDLLPTFRLAHRAIKLFCSQHGITGNRFGYLGGTHITLLLLQTTLSLQSMHAVTAGFLVRKFFAENASRNWTDDIVDASRRIAASVYKRGIYEPMVILSIQRPVVNVASSATRHTVETIQREFERAAMMLAGGCSIEKICGTSTSAVARFVKGYDTYLKIDVSYWGGSASRCRCLVSFIEFRLVGLLIDMYASKPDTRAQLWPRMFTYLGDQGNNNKTTVRGFYLVGLSRRDEGGPVGQQGVSAAALRNFTDAISNGDFYDSAETFVSILVVGRAQLQLANEIVLVQHTWDSGGDEEVEAGEEDADPPSLDSVHTHGAANLIKGQRSSITAHVPAATKLRTSADVYNRLMWDAHMDRNDYVVGYEDRFDGVKEVPLTSWKREVEDEAFIPFHRVMHFRRKTDGVIVWDRQTKSDLLFGSGNGGICAGPPDYCLS